MRMPRPWIVIVAVGVALAWGVSDLSAQGVSTWLEPVPGQPVGASRPLPTTPGHHKLQFEVALPGLVAQNNQAKPTSATVKMSYELYLPVGYDKVNTGWPMIVFLHGCGEVGSDLNGIMYAGPSAETTRNAKFGAQFPCIVLSPQCPAGKRWDTPGMAQAVAALIRDVEARWRVDHDRVYGTGLSMGGEGTWLVALAAPELFAAIAPISAIAVEPEVAAKKLKGVAIWIIIGAEDGGFAEGSRRMVKVLTQAGIDATLTEVPGEGHFVWPRFYPKPGFYNWRLANRRGKPPAMDRLQPAQLLAVGMTDTPDMRAIAQLSNEFKQFLPYWFLLNCGRDNQPGFKPQFSGRTGVFVTSPLNKDVPCALQITQALPAGRKAVLHMLVGREPAKGAWHLTVRADSKDIFNQAIDATTCPKGWTDLSVDLSPYAGQTVRLDVLDHAPADAGAIASAYWNRVTIEYH